MRKPIAIVLGGIGAIALVWFLAFLVVVVEALIGVMSSQTVADITVENHSNEPVISGEIEFLGDKHPFANIGLGETSHISFRVNGEGAYRIRARLASGKELNSGAYLTSGFPSDTRIADTAEVTSDGIAVRRSVGSVRTAR